MAAGQLGTDFAVPGTMPVRKSSALLSICAWLALSGLAFSAMACSGGESEDLGADAGIGPDAALDAGPSYADGDWLFEEDRVIEVVIDLPAASWDELRLATRNILDVFGDNCALAPAPEAFFYVSGSVSIEGELLENVGMRKKGFLGSLDTNKPSIKIKTDEYVVGQKLSGLSRFTLNNTVQDPSYMNQCLGYKLFRSAGVPAPRCNFAHVTVNGEDMGLYTHVEDVKKPFLRNHFDSDEGNLYEGTISDFRSGWTGTFEKKTNEIEVAMPEIDALSDALALDGDAMRAALDPILDVDEFMRFWAVETLIAHGDGYSGNNNNFFVYADPSTGKMSFLPWGADQLFHDAAGSRSAARTRSILPRKLFLHSTSRSQYIAAMEDILDQVWDEDEVLAEVARMESLLRPLVLDDELSAFDEEVASLRSSVTGREAEVRAKLQGLSAADSEALMEPLCFAKDGSITGNFSTTWTTQGTADLNVVLAGETLNYTLQTSVAGPDGNTEGQGVIGVFGDFADGSRTLVYLPLPVGDVAPGTIAIDNGAILFYPPGSDTFNRVEFVAGTLTLDQASTSPGQPVVGSLDFDVWKSPFL